MINMNPVRQIILSPFADEKTEAYSNNLLRVTKQMAEPDVEQCLPDITSCWSS